jgi:hypothetical protein
MAVQGLALCRILDAAPSATLALRGGLRTACCVPSILRRRAVAGVRVAGTVSTRQ